MSWEGYQQNLCTNGHAFDTDADVDINDPDFKCPRCQAKVAWFNIVDLTNGCFNVDLDGNETDERIDGMVMLQQLTPAEICKCDACGHCHTSKPATYRIPDIGGHRI